MDYKSSPSILIGTACTMNPIAIDEMFEKIATSQLSNNTALVFEDHEVTRNLTYSELEAFANRLARWIAINIIENNLNPNDDGDYVVGVSMCPSDYLVVTLLAIWKVGACILPLDSIPKPRVQHILQEAKPMMIVYDTDNKQFSEDTYKFSVSQLLKDSKGLSSIPLTAEESLKGRSKNKIAAILYTSGSTGIPKGVRLSHKNIFNRLQWQFKTFPYSPNETTVIFKTALTFADSIGEIWGPLLNGLTLIVAPKGTTQNPEKFVNLLEKHKIERLVLVPSLLGSLLMYFEMNKCRQFLPYLKIWVCSGEVLLKSHAVEFYKYFPSDYRLCNFYGSTEIMADVTYYTISGLQQLDQYEKIPIGVPIDNTILYLLDAERSPVNIGEVGELFVSGLNVSEGYVSGRDSEKFLDNHLATEPGYEKLYRTGDFAKIDKGLVIYEGRTDSQIKVRGYRVDLSEIEKTVNAVHGVAKGVVLCYKAGELHQSVIAFVTTVTGLSKFDIETVLKQNLADYMVPQVFVVDDIPLLPSGKIDRQVLYKLYEALTMNTKGETADYSKVPKSQIEAAKALFESVISVIKQPLKYALSLSCNFYEIGGNSLNTMMAILMLREKGYYIGIGDFISAKNFEEILNKISTSAIEMVTEASRNTYSIEALRDEHKADSLDIIASSFHQKGVLEPYVDGFTEKDSKNFIRNIWGPLIMADLSFVVKSNSHKIIAVALSFDAREEPTTVAVHSQALPRLEFVQSLKKPFLDNYLPTGKGKVMRNHLVATHLELSAQENIAVALLSEAEIIAIAKRRNFEGVFSINSNVLMQKLATEVFLYKTLLDYQVNKFVASNNTKPFARAPDSLRILVQYKVVNEFRNNYCNDT